MSGAASSDPGHGRRVLVCGAETQAAFAFVSTLRRRWGHAVRVVTADSNSAGIVTASLLADRHVVTPTLRDGCFEASLAAILAEEAITDYVPLNDSEFPAAEALRASHPDVDIWSSPLFAELALDKLAAHLWLERLGLPVPIRYTAASLPESGMIFAKPRRGYGGRGAARQPVELIRRVTREVADGLMLQEICNGPEVTVDSFFDAATGGHRAIVRERLRVKAGICTVARLHEDQRLAAYGRRIGEALGQRGTICFQAMQAVGGWVITDLNMRPGAGTTMGAAAGIDLVGAAIACRWGEPYAAMIAGTLPVGGVHVTRQYSDFVMP